MQLLDDMMKEIVKLQNEIKNLQAKVNLPVQVKVDTGSVINALNEFTKKLDGEKFRQDKTAEFLIEFESRLIKIKNEIPTNVQKVYKVEFKTLMLLSIIAGSILLSGWFWWYFKPAFDNYNIEEIKKENLNLKKKLEYMIEKNPKSSKIFDSNR